MKISPMKATLFFSGESGKIKRFFSDIEARLKKEGVDTAMVQAGTDSAGEAAVAVRVRGSAFVVVGSPVVGWTGGISPTLESFLKGSSLFEGKKVAVFVEKKFFGAKAALRRLMEAVEKQGGFVFDFEVLSCSRKAGEFAARLLSVRDAGKGTG
jgi:flavorubredoxin